MGRDRVASDSWVIGICRPRRPVGFQANTCLTFDLSRYYSCRMSWRARTPEGVAGRGRPAPKLRVVDRVAEAPENAPPVVLDDVELVGAMRRHDETAAAVFHDRVLPQIEGTIFRLLGRRDVDHEDLIQATLIELISTIRRFRGECSLNTWVGTLTAHVVWKHLRRRGTEASLFAASGMVDVAAPGPSPAAGVVMRGIVGRIRAHLARLSPDKAWAFLLHEVCGYDFDETARIMGVSRSAAQARVVRGRRELHALISADPELSTWISEPQR